MVVVCGEALMDVVEGRASPGGGPFNTARALARLGVPVAFLGRLSDDGYGRELAAALASDGVSLALASVGHERTTVADAVIDEKGVARYRFDVEDTSAPDLTLDMVPPRLASDVSALHVGTLGLVLEPMASTLVEVVDREREGRLVMLDPNIRPGLIPDDAYRERLARVVGYSTVVKASEADLAWLYPGGGHRAAAASLLDAGVRLVVVTLGVSGALGAMRDCEASVDAIRVEVVDTIGAGDAFGAALLAWLHDHDALKPDLRLEQAQLKSALEFASLAAAVTCSRAGADPPWKWEMSSRRNVDVT
jgi:fructokinase